MGVFKFFAMVGFILAIAAYVSSLAINSAQNDEIRHMQTEIHALQHPHKK